MLELSRQKLKEDLYNVGAFAIETYGALQIQVIKEDTVREIDSEYFYRTEKKNLQQIDKYYLVVGEENFIYSSDAERPISVLMDEIRAIDPNGNTWETLERAGTSVVIDILQMLRMRVRASIELKELDSRYTGNLAKMRPEALEALLRSAREKAKKTFTAPVEFNNGFYRDPRRWGEP